VTRLSAYLISMLLHLGMPFLILLGFAFADSELPAQYVPGCILVDPIESLNPLSLLQGATEPEVDEFFGAQSTSTRRRPPDWCVRYKYSPRLSYALLFRHGRVESIRLTQEDLTPYSCEGILVRTVEVARRDWYPSAMPPRRSPPGCPPLGDPS
jgi:hypothetical protein